MAEENQQTPRVGPVSQQNQPQNRAPQTPQPGAQQNARGVPGAQPPPIPSPEQIQEVMRRQQAEQQRQIQEARERAQQLMGVPQAQAPAENSRMSQQAHRPPAQQPQHQAPQQAPAYPGDQNPNRGPQQMSSPPPGFPPEAWATMPPQMQQAYLDTVSKGNQQVQQPQQPQQPQYQPQPQQNQFAQAAQPQPIVQDVVHWHPARSKGVDIHLTDTIIKNVPAEGIRVESDPQARVVLALFAEILVLRDELQNRQVPQMSQDFEMRIRRLEGALFEQANAMNQRARSVREQIQMLASKGLSSDQIIDELNGISSKAEQQVAVEGRTPGPQNEDHEESE